MPSLPQNMNELASILEKKAALADAIAVDHEMNNEPTLARNQRRRAENARFYAEQCREAAKGLQRRTAQRGFIPPAWEEVDLHCQKFADWPFEDRRQWFDHFASVGWKVGMGKQMVDWKAAASNGYRRWQKENPANTRSAPRKANPNLDGMREV